jgi:membrane fusion protein, macrolide-specific efflux system
MEKNIKALTFSTKKRKIATLLVILALTFFGWQILKGQKQQVQYQTAQAQKGTLIVSLIEAGQVAIANKVSVVTQASGIVNNIYVKSGDTVNAGDKIADITLDTAGQQRQAQAWSSYLSTQNSLNSAQAKINSLQSALFKANQTFMNDKGTINPITDDPKYIQEKADWLQAEADYKNQSGVIAQSQANLSNSNLTYQLTSGTIVAPTAGVISDLTITQGLQIGSSNTTSGSSTNTSNQAIASIKTGNSTTVMINIAEVDVSRVQVGQKATLTLDAIANKTFTGKVMGINTSGAISSGVVTYPAVIQLDDISNSDILPNMSATASIISKVKDNVLLIPSSAVVALGSASTVKVMKNGQVATVDVQTGDSSDSQTEIISGISEGDTVVTSTISTATTTSTGSSPFSSGLRFGGFGGGGAVRTGGGGRTGN